MNKLCMIVGLVALLAAASVHGLDQLATQGNWQGEFESKKWEGTPIAAQVVADKQDTYRATLLVGDGADAATARMIRGVTENDKVAFSAQVDLGAKYGGSVKVQMTIEGDELEGKISGKGAPGKFEMKRIEIKPPTLGEKAPAGAVVLFDGGSLDAWNFGKEPWAIVDGAMEVREGNIRTKEEFGDHQIHLEFRTPFMPGARGQARGNSGVYVHGRYEVQVLDSFGLEPKDNECGGIYKKAVPKMNACLPPMEWQAYDIVFHAPQFDANGAKTKDATITVTLNGQTIHDNVVFDSVCPGGISDQEAPKGPIMLQDHHNKVQFRNIWVKPL